MIELLNTLGPILDDNNWGLRVEERADGTFRAFVFEHHVARGQADSDTPSGALAALLQSLASPTRRKPKSAE